MLLQQWTTKEVPVNWKLANMIYSKDQKDDVGKYRPVSLTSVWDKVMEQIMLNAVTWHVRIIRCSGPVSMGL